MNAGPADVGRHSTGPDTSAEPREAHDEYRAALALRHTPGLGPRTWKRIAESFPSLTEAAQNAARWPELGLARRKVAEAFLSKSWRKAAEAEYLLARKHGLRLLTWSDPRFSRRLKTIPDAPLYLYYLGDTALLNAPSVALVGSRNCSEYGLHVARALGQDLSAAGITIVSGLALGIDRQAHLAGLAGPGSSVAVLGTGLDRIYPESNADVWERLRTQGLIVTEYPPLTIPEPQNFPIRNRIISGLALGVLVAEAAEKSGSLITARLSLDQGREVFALPGPLTQATYGGCHALIRQGAHLVTSAEEIISILDHELRCAMNDGEGRPGFQQSNEPGARSTGRTAERDPETPATQGVIESAPDAGFPAATLAFDESLLTPEERMLLSRLALDDRGGKVHIDVLARETDLASGVVSSVLLGLEIKGLVRQWPGMYYGRKK